MRSQRPLASHLFDGSVNGSLENTTNVSTLMLEQVAHLPHLFVKWPPSMARPPVKSMKLGCAGHAIGSRNRTMTQLRSDILFYACFFP